MDKALSIFLQHSCVYTRSGLRLLLDEFHHYNLVNKVVEAENVKTSTCRTLQNLNVDVFILGIQNNIKNLSEVLRFIIEWLPLFSPQSKVIIMAPKSSIGPLSEYLLGLKNVCAVLDNGSSLDVLRLQLKTVLQFPKHASYYISPVTNLTCRELNVLDYLLKGISIRDIAKKQRINYKTVSSYKQSALRKLGMRSLNYLLTTSNRRKAVTEALNRMFQALPKNNSVISTGIGER